MKKKKGLISLLLTFALLIQSVLPGELSLFGAVKAFADDTPKTEVTELNLISSGVASADWFQSAKLTRKSIDRSSKKLSLSLSAAISNSYLEDTVWDYMDSECSDLDPVQLTDALKTKYADSLPEIVLTFSGEYFSFPEAVIGEDNAVDMKNAAEDVVATRKVEKDGSNYKLTFSFNLERVANYEMNIKGECSLEVFLKDTYSEYQKVGLNCSEDGHLIGLTLDPLNASDAKPPEAALPVYSLTKTVTNAEGGIADDFYLTYDIVAKVTGGDGTACLDGMFIDDILPKDAEEKNIFNIESVSFGETTLEPISTAGGASRYQIPTGGKLTEVKLTVSTYASTELYDKYIKEREIDETIENTAKLYGTDGKTELSSDSETVQLQKKFFSKNGVQNKNDSRKIDWTLTAEASHTHASGIYLIDRVEKTSHEYIRDSITVSVNGGEPTAFKGENVIDISDQAYYDSLDSTKKSAVDAFYALGEDVFSSISGDLTETASGDCKDLYTALGLDGTKAVFFSYTATDDATKAEKAYECFILPMDSFFTNTNDTPEGLKSYICSLDIKYTTRITAVSDAAYDNMVKEGFSADLKNDARLVYDHFCGGIGPGKHAFSFDFKLNKGCKIEINSFTKRAISYDENTQNASWNFEVNRYGTAMTDFYLIDVVPASRLKFEGTDPISAEVFTNETNTQLSDGGTLSVPYFAAGNDFAVEKGTDGNYNITDFGGLSAQAVGYTYAKIDDNYVFAIKLGAINEANHVVFELKTKVIDEAFLADTKKASFSNAAYGYTQTEENGAYSLYKKTAAIYAENALIEKGAIERGEGDSKYTYNYKDNTVQWETTINPNFIPITDLMVTDTLPVGAKLKSIDSVTVYSNATTSKVYSTAINVDKALYEITIDGSDNVTFSDILNDKKDVTSGYFINSYIFTGLGVADDTHKYVIRYTTEWDDTDGYRTKEFGTDKEAEFINTVLLTGKVQIEGTGVEIDAEAKAYCIAAFDRVRKSGKTDSARGVIDWEVLVNTDLRSFGNNSLDYKIVDTISGESGGISSHCFDIFSDMRIYAGTMNQTGTAFDQTGAEDITAKVIAAEGGLTTGEKGFTIAIPTDYESKCICIKYTSEILDLATSFVPVNNVAYESTDESYKQSDNNAAASAFNASSFDQSAISNKVPSIMVRKHGDNAFGNDQSFSDMSGAVFTLSATFTVNGATKEYSKTRKTNAKGVALFSGLKENVVYTLTETTGSEKHTALTDYNETAGDWIMTPSDSTSYPSLNEEKTGKTTTFLFKGEGDVSGTADVVIDYKENAGRRVFADVYNNLYSSGSLTFSKKDAESNIDLVGAKFTLTGTTAEGCKVKKEYVTDENGDFTIERLPIAKADTVYTLTETGPITGYEKANLPYYEISVTHSGDIVTTTVTKKGTTDETVSLTEGNYEITDSYYCDKTGFTIFKADELYKTVNNSLRKIGGEAKFTLTMTKQADGLASTAELVDADAEITKYDSVVKTTDADGKVKFENLPYGEYTLTETGVPDRYTAFCSVYNVTVDYTGVKITYGEAKTSLEKPNGEFVIYNTPKATEASLYKYYTVNGTKYPIKGLSFTLTEFADSTVNDWLDSGDTNWSTNEKRTFKTNDDGIVNFGMLPLGIYELTEIDADFTKMNSDERYFIVVYEDGEVVKMSLVTTNSASPTAEEILGLKAIASKLTVGTNEYYALENKKVTTNAGVTFVKTDSTTKAANATIAGAAFTLSGKTAQGRELSSYTEVVTNVVSDANGEISFGALPVSDTDGYTLTETKSGDCYEIIPMGGKIVAFVHVDNNGNVTVKDANKTAFPAAEKYTIGNAEYMSGFSIEKKDSTVGSFAVEGAKYELYYQGGGLGSTIYGFVGTDGDQTADYTVTTGTDGKASFTNVKVGNYTMREVLSVAGTNAEKYTLDPTAYSVAVSKTGVTVKNGDTDVALSDGCYQFTDMPATATLTLYKYVLGENGAKIPVKPYGNDNKGVCFKIEGGFNGFFTDANDTYYTDASGILKIENIPVGVYTVTETDGDFVSNSFTVTVTYNQSENAVAIAASKGGTGLPNSATNGFELQNSYKTNSFTVKKTDATENADGSFSPIENVTFTLTMLNSAQGRVYVAGDNVKYIYTAITDSAGIALFADIPVGTYTLSETDGNEGYEPISPVEVIVSDSVKFGGSVYESNKFTVSNTPYTADIKIAKTYTYNNGTPASLNKTIGTASFTLTSTEVVPSIYPDIAVWNGETGDDGTLTFKNVHDGAYSLTETTVSEGYEKSSETYSITVENGTVTAISGSASGTVTAENGAYRINNAVLSDTLRVKKTDENGSTITESAFFKLTADGVNQKTVFGAGFGTAGVPISTINGVATFENVPAGNYLLTETTAPAHYELNNAAYLVTVSYNGGVRTITAVNTQDGTDALVYNASEQTLVFPNKFMRTDVSFVKRGDSGEKVEASFKITSDNAIGGFAEKTLAANAENNYTVKLEGLTDGIYTVTETSRTTNYAKNTASYTLTVDGGAVMSFTDGTNSILNAVSGKYEITNTILKTSLSIVKTDDDTTPNAVEGATFTLTANAANIAQYAKTPVNSVATANRYSFSDIPVGSYTLVESVVPSGYETPCSWTLEIVDDGGAAKARLFKNDAEGNKTASTLTVTNGEVTIVNVHKIATLLIKKVDSDNNNLPIEGIEFSLVGDFGRDETLSTDENGIISFENVYDGNYTLTETDWGEYAAPTVSYLVTVSDRAVASLKENNDGKAPVLPENGTYILKNNRQMADYIINKTDDQSTPQVLDGVTFTLTGSSAYGTNDVNRTATYEKINGQYVYRFADVPKSAEGGYTLTEAVPEHYGAARTSYTLKYDGTAFVLSAPDFTSTSENPVTIVNDADYASVKLIKRDSLGNPLAGSSVTVSGSFDIGSFNGIDGYDKQSFGTSDANGVFALGETETILKLYDGNYTLTETQTPKGYYTNSWVLTVSGGKITAFTSSDSTASLADITVKNGIALLALKNTMKTADILLSKTNEKDSSPIAGAEFTLSGTSQYFGDYIKIVKSASNGAVEFNSVPLGSYTLTETCPAGGYFENETVYEVAVSEENGKVSAELSINEQTVIAGTANGEYIIKNRPLETDITVYKHDISVPVSGALSGVKFVLSSGGTVKYETASDSNGYARFTNVALGEYTLTEQTPSGFIASTDNYIVTVSETADHKCAVTVTKNGEAFSADNGSYKIGNEPDSGKLVVTKTSDDEKVTGIKFRIIGTDYLGNSVDAETEPTDADGHTEIVLKKGEYKVSESLSETMKAYYENLGKKTITLDYSGANVAFPNVSVRTDIRIKKTDSEQALPLDGARFRLSGTTAAGAEFEQESTTENAIASFAAVPVGVYTLVEIDSPAHYELDPTEYTVSVKYNYSKNTVSVRITDGTSELTGTLLDGFTFVNSAKLTTLSFVKLSDSGKPLATSFSLKSDSDKNIGRKAVNLTLENRSEFSFENLIDGTYILTETKRVAGYKENPTSYTITINGGIVVGFTDGERSMLNAESKRYEIINEALLGTLELTKTDQNGAALLGGEYTLTDEGGKEYASTVSENKQTFSALPLGTYSLVEKNIPEGFSSEVSEWILTISDDNGNAACTLREKLNDHSVTVIDGCKAAIIHTKLPETTTTTAPIVTTPTSQSTTKTTTTATAPITTQPEPTTGLTEPTTVITETTEATGTTVPVTTTLNEVTTVPETTTAQTTVTPETIVIERDGYTLELPAGNEFVPEEYEIVVKEIPTEEAKTNITDENTPIAKAFTIEMPKQLQNTGAVIGIKVGTDNVGKTITVYGVDSEGVTYTVENVLIDEHGYIHVGFLGAGTFYAVLTDTIEVSIGTSEEYPSTEENTGEGTNPNTGALTGIIPMIVSGVVVSTTARRRKKSNGKRRI